MDLVLLALDAMYIVLLGLFIVMYAMYALSTLIIIVLGLENA